ncbi:type II CAAX prenyl endopeptidase Rce1 family protein [Photobacterium rosenbergii]|uniref:CPBP family glutamic-type intramembrane protease n=1 Tax=Photobacterium rosenbergii TaxID=294936 RepID=UPI001C9973C4|nr:CPBP family glutamic-type intramembrane protease [Photobacterium rosenbergii]MBY5945512.1 CPBP family intramembrane metalloprotease [Photobacterium rosenbergii]
MVVKDLYLGLLSFPRHGLKLGIAAALGFSAFAVGFGLSSGLFTFAPVKYPNAYFLILTMVIFPSLLEEGIFRGLLIPRKVFGQSTRQQWLYILGSSVIFVLWHPFNAFLFNTSAQLFFYDLRFLLIVMVLGVTCGYLYIKTHSLWPCVVVHWLTVVCWVFIFGGRNLLGEVA